MKRPVVLSLILLSLLVTACKSKEKEPEKKEAYFPVLSFIHSQIAHIDTSLYSIKRIITYDSLHSDTDYVRREDFEKAAKDFLDIPDLSDKKIAARYTEEKLYDETLNTVIFSYTPIHPEQEEIQKQQVIVKPDIAAGDKVSSIIIDRQINTRDSSMQKNMLWQADKLFQVATTTQLPGKPEVTVILQVIWNEDEE